jgi:hypothetical protein
VLDARGAIEGARAPRRSWPASRRCSRAGEAVRRRAKRRTSSVGLVEEARAPIRRRSARRAAAEREVVGAAARSRAAAASARVGAGGPLAREITAPARPERRVKRARILVPVFLVLLAPAPALRVGEGRRAQSSCSGTRSTSRSSSA